MVEFKTNYPRLIRNKDWKALKDSQGGFDPIQISQLIEEIPEDEEIIVFRCLNRQQAKEVFHLLTQSKQEQIIEGLAQNSQKVANLLNDIEPDDRTAFIEELPGQVTQRLIQVLNPVERDVAVRLLGYPDDSIGRLMTPEYVAVKSQDLVSHAFEHIRLYGRDSETLNVIYVFDNDWKLIDDIRIKEIFQASPKQKIADLMDYRFVALHVMNDQETAIKTFKDYDRAVLPVVDEESVMLGIVTFDDIMDITDEETTEDFHKFGSLQMAIGNPLKERALNLYKNRIVWLVALVFMNVFSGAAISSFETVIQSMVSLVFFLPIPIDSAGNAGSQSATLMIRSLTVGDVKISDWSRLIGKEIVVSFLLAITMAIGVTAMHFSGLPKLSLSLPLPWS